MIDELKQRIRETVPAIKFVGETADFQSAVESNPPAVPALFIVELEEQARPPQLDVLTQKVDAAIGLVFVVRNLGDTKGAAAKSQLRELRQLVRDQVYGWQPAPKYDPLSRGQSHLLAFRDGHVWWQDQYVTSFYDRSLL